MPKSDKYYVDYQLKYIPTLFIETQNIAISFQWSTTKLSLSKTAILFIQHFYSALFTNKYALMY